jgi:hypothetical protein
LKLEQTEVGTLFVYALRYTIGRATYAVGEMCDLVRDRWSEIPDRTRTIMIRDVEEAVQSSHPLGHTCDRSSWERLLKWMKENADA